MHTKRAQLNKYYVLYFVICIKRIRNTSFCTLLLYIVNIPRSADVRWNQYILTPCWVICNPFHLSSNNNRLPVKGHEVQDPLNAWLLSNCMPHHNLWAALRQFVAQRFIQCAWNLTLKNWSIPPSLSIRSAIRKVSVFVQLKVTCVMKSASAPLSG